MQHQELIEKIRGLSPEKIAEVVDFVDFLTNRDERRLVEAASRMAEPAFAIVWDNPDDAEYDNL
ncbi:MAG: toxin-antitoxin system, antitoxin component, Xre family protein [Acidobacteria bacterium]|nr:MAG: toxin-antitoxin system, antitoxin component, Xre family protein [Acidobacteriota bacterium]